MSWLTSYVTMSNRPKNNYNIYRGWNQQDHKLQVDSKKKTINNTNRKNGTDTY